MAAQIRSIQILPETEWELNLDKIVLQKPNIPYYDSLLLDTPYKKYQCVGYAQARTGVDVSGWGTARLIPTNATTPSVGAIVKLNEGKYGHVAVVEDIDGDYLILSEANLEADYINGGFPKFGRRININDRRIEGYVIK